MGLLKANRDLGASFHASVVAGGGDPGKLVIRAIRRRDHRSQPQPVLGDVYDRPAGVSAPGYSN